jgi:hypothetical protein
VNAAAFSPTCAMLLLPYSTAVNLSCEHVAASSATQTARTASFRQCASLLGHLISNKSKIDIKLEPLLLHRLQPRSMSPSLQTLIPAPLLLHKTQLFHLLKRRHRMQPILHMTFWVFFTLNWKFGTSIQTIFTKTETT